MKKLIPLFFGLMIPLSGAFANEFVDQAVEFCRSRGGSYSMGTMVEEGNKYCRQVTCKKTTSERFEIPEGAPGPEANVEATKRVCVDKSVIDGSFNTNGAQSGSGSGSNSTSGATSGANATSGAGAGEAGAGAGGSDSYICEELVGEGRIEKGGLCYNECRPKRAILGIIGRKKEGFERKACVECLLRYPGVYSVKAEYLPKDKHGKVIGDKSVSLGKGVSVKTGVIICKDSKGNIVHVEGTACPPGAVLHGGTIGSGSGTIVVGGGKVTSGSGIGAGGSIIIAGGAGGGAGIERPAYCNSSKKKDLKLCEEWMRANARFLCASSSNPSMCLGGEYSDIMARYDVSNCVNCGVGSRKQSTLSGIAEIVGAIAPPLAQFGSAWVGAKAYQKGQEAWAGAAVKGFEQCQISQNNYMQYLAANELPGLSPAQQAAMNCNGFQLGGFAGMQNPYLGGWYGAGYTPGMIGGMMGPWGGMYPGMGGMTGGMVGGIQIAGGINSGMMTGGMCGASGCPSYITGGYPGGMMTGGYVAGGMMTGGYVGGYPGGMMTGGYVGGYPGGMMTGGYIGGYSGGAINPGYTGGMVGGMVNGISIAGGVAGGYPGGMMTGGYVGGYPGGMMTGGYVAGGMMTGGYAGGYAGGYMAGGMVGGGYAGGYAGGYMAGGYAGGYMAGGMNGGYIASQNAANIDGMLQQQGMMNQVGIVTGAGGYNPYGAGGYPMNAGMGMGVGMYGGMGW